jgi:hypothetical protein
MNAKVFPGKRQSARHFVQHDIKRKQVRSSLQFSSPRAYPGGISSRSAGTPTSNAARPPPLARQFATASHPPDVEVAAKGSLENAHAKPLGHVPAF